MCLFPRPCWAAGIGAGDWVACRTLLGSATWLFLGFVFMFEGSCVFFGVSIFAFLFFVVIFNVLVLFFVLVGVLLDLRKI